ncbi:MAG: transposase [Candidatus Heimdallarchaeota archaeon]
MSSFIKHLNFSKYTSRLPGHTPTSSRGGYPKLAYLKALLLKGFLQLTYRDLEAFLRRYPSYATACGFLRAQIPHYSRFAKFFTRLEPSLVDDISIDVTRKLIRRLRMPCRFLGVDSTSSRAYANSFTKKGDPDAEVGKSSVKGFFYGYKIHLVVDGQTDLPVAFEVTAGNVYDGHRLLPLLRKAVKITRKRPKAVIADKGYDAGYNYVGVVEEMMAAPVIAIRGRRRRVVGRQTTLEDFFLQRQGNRRKKRRRRTKTQEQRLRQNPPIARGSEEWKVLARFRASAERAISRLKAIFGLERLRVRGLARVRKHVGLCIIGLLESALYLAKRGRPRLVRSFPYMV